RFFLVPKESAAYVPCGYEEEPYAEAGDMLIYRNLHALPLGYFYDSFLDKKDWDSLNIGDKMYNQLRGCLINTPDEALFKDFQNIEPERMASEERYDPDRAYSSSKDEELYYVAEGISYASDWEEAGMNVYYGDREKHWEYKTKYSPTYTGINSFAVQMSSGAEKTESIIETLDDPDITVASASVVKLPLQKAYAQLDLLKAHAIENITVQDNRICGMASLDRPMILQLAVPYSSHWHVTIDGEEGRIYCSGVYMAVPMQAGEHSVEFAYR
nr:YfhO family protein [Lachnospiraceae bacterium]